jgi:hypothetical protein
MGLGPFGASAPLFLRNGELLGHSPILKHGYVYVFGQLANCHIKVRAKPGKLSRLVIAKGDRFIMSPEK